MSPVIHGDLPDTDWDVISDGTAAGPLGEGYTLALRRWGALVEMRFNVHSNPAAMPTYTFPPGYRPHSMDLQRMMYRGGTTSATGSFRILNGRLTYTGSTSVINATGQETWLTSDPPPS